MNYLRDLIYRLRAGESERRIAADLGLSRPTVHKYHLLAEGRRYLTSDSALPDDAALQAVLGAAPEPQRQPSTVAAYTATVEQLREQGCEMTAMFARLREDYDYRNVDNLVGRILLANRGALAA
jgi:transposase-like protein